MFSGQIRPANYNGAWNALRLQYQGITPQGERPANAFDPGAKYHIPANVPYTRYFLARILQFQFFEAACKEAGWTGPLHRCSFYGNEAVGTRLNAMLEMGASRPWPDALEAFTGSREMSGRAMVEYFRPLMTWLQEQNRGPELRVVRAPLALAALAIAAPLSAQQTMLAPGETLLEVAAEGRAFAPPDLATLRGGVTTNDPTTRGAVAANATAMTAVIAALRRAGVPPETSGRRVFPCNHNMIRTNGAPVGDDIVLYRHHGVNITVRDLHRTSDYLSALFDAGATDVAGPFLRADNDAPLIAAARQDAVARARAQAESYAAAFGMRVARVVRISERARRQHTAKILSSAQHQGRQDHRHPRHQHPRPGPRFRSADRANRQPVGRFRAGSALIIISAGPLNTDDPRARPPIPGGWDGRAAGALDAPGLGDQVAARAHGVSDRP